MDDQERYQFTIRDMFLSVTLIALGIGGFWTVVKAILEYHVGLFLLPPVWLLISGGPALVGAGIGTLFRQKVQGASIAVAIFWLVVLSWVIIANWDKMVGAP